MRRSLYPPPLLAGQPRAGTIHHSRAPLPRARQEQMQPFKVTFPRARGRVCTQPPPTPPVVKWGLCSAKQQVSAPEEQRVPTSGSPIPSIAALLIGGGGIGTKQIPQTTHCIREGLKQTEKRRSDTWHVQAHVCTSPATCKGERETKRLSEDSLARARLSSGRMM